MSTRIDIGATARMTFQEVAAMGEAREPLPEVFQPVIARGVGDGVALVEHYAPGMPPEMESLFLMREENPPHAYLLFGKLSRLLDHHATNWGQIHYAVMLTRRKHPNRLVFRAPIPAEAQRVAIKRLDKAVVQDYLDRGGQENPYKELARLQQIGDSIHVLGCVDAMEDDRYLYIVMPYCHEGSLMDHVPWNRGFDNQNLAKAIFRNILEILLYLERHGIFHHDLSPDNLLYFQGRLLLFDFAMSLRVPREDDGRRYLIRPMGAYGTLPCMAPEIFFNQAPFDGIAADLWAAAVTLYSILTGHMLYRMPHPSDMLFRYYILAGGLRGDLNEEIVEIFEESFVPGSGQNDLMTHAMANMNIPPDARELLIGLLQLNPAERWTLAQAFECAWMQNP